MQQSQPQRVTATVFARDRVHDHLLAGAVAEALLVARHLLVSARHSPVLIIFTAASSTSRASSMPKVSIQVRATLPAQGAQIGLHGGSPLGR